MKSGKTVLFSGTPCQIAGLKNYLKDDYDNLICVDIACHGVPSSEDFKKCIKHLEEKHGGKLKNVDFRDKTKGNWSHRFSYVVADDNGEKKYVKFPSQIPYYYFFLHAENLRNSCYKCIYSQFKRVGDITLADCWGIENINLKINSKHGASTVLINTKKGSKIFENVKNKTIKSQLGTVGSF